jgi:hypothetical protein
MTLRRFSDWFTAPAKVYQFLPVFKHHSFLSADGVQQAKSGHPGLPMGTAPIAYTIWTRYLRHNPANPGGQTETGLSSRAGMDRC